jgi:MFS family permease
MTIETPEAPAREPIFTRDFSLLFLANLTNFLGFYLLLATLPAYISGFVPQQKVVGVILGVFGLIGLLLRPIVGRLADLRGGKKIMLAGSAVLLLATVLYPRGDDALSFFGLRVLHGLGWAAFGTAASALIALIAPEKRRGEAMGYYGMSTNVAMAVAPAVGVFVVHQSGWGYSGLFALSAGLVLLAGCVTLPVADRCAEACSMSRGWRAYFLPSAIFPSAVAGISTLTYASVAFYLPQFSAEANLGNAGLFFTAFAIVLVLTRGPLGKLSDRLGRAAVIIPGLLCSAAAMALLALWPSNVMLLVVAGLYGLGIAAVQPTLMAMATDRAGPAERGAAMGTYTTAFDLGIGGGAMLCGVLIDAAGFRTMYLVSGGLSLLGVIVLAAGGGFAKKRGTESIEASVPVIRNP